jgi:hypothetical protein
MRKQDRSSKSSRLLMTWMDKYALLIELGNSLPPLEEKYKTESNLIAGCQSGCGCRRIMRRVSLRFGRERRGDRERDRLFC